MFPFKYFIKILQNCEMEFLLSIITSFIGCFLTLVVSHYINKNINLKRCRTDDDDVVVETPAATIAKLEQTAPTETAAPVAEHLVAPVAAPVAVLPIEFPIVDVPAKHQVRPKVLLCFPDLPPKQSIQLLTALKEKLTSTPALKKYGKIEKNLEKIIRHFEKSDLSPLKMKIGEYNSILNRSPIPFDFPFFGITFEEQAVIPERGIVGSDFIQRLEMAGICMELSMSPESFDADVAALRSGTYQPEEANPTRSFVLCRCKDNDSVCYATNDPVQHTVSLVSEANCTLNLAKCDHHNFTKHLEKCKTLMRFCNYLEVDCIRPGCNHKIKMSRLVGACREQASKTGENLDALYLHIKRLLASKFEKQKVILPVEKYLPNIKTCIGRCQNTSCKVHNVPTMAFSLYDIQNQMKTSATPTMGFCTNCNKVHDVNLHTFACSHCSVELCTVCGSNHRNRPCPGSIVADIDQATRDFLTQETRACPDCHNVISKMPHTCDKMTCTCGTLFCFRCGQKLTHGNDVHGRALAYLHVCPVGLEGAPDPNFREHFEDLDAQEHQIGAAWDPNPNGDNPPPLDDNIDEDWGGDWAD